MFFKKRLPSRSFAENFLGGYMTIGPVTIFGENAMHWAVVTRLPGGFFSFRLPLRCFGDWWPLYCFFSPDGTPANATRWFWGRRARRF
jgi:hypothetical protein